MWITSFVVTMGPMNAVVGTTGSPRRSLGVCVRRVVHRRMRENMAVEQQEVAELGVADARRVGQHGVKDRLQFARRLN